MARLTRIICVGALLVLGADAPLQAGSPSWAPGDRLPPLLVAEVNRRIAGSLRARSLQWKVPDTVVAHDLVVLDPEGQVVALASRLEAKVRGRDLAMQVLQFEHVEVSGLKLKLIADKRGVNIARAFVIKGQASSDAPLSVKIASLLVRGADVLFNTEQTTIAIQGVDIDGELRVDKDGFFAALPTQIERAVVKVGDLSVRVDALKSARIEVTNSEVRTKALSFKLGEQQNQIKGLLSWKGPGQYALSGQLRLPANYWPLASKRPPVVTGPIAATFEMNGVLDDPQFAVRLDPCSITAATYPLTSVTGVFHINKNLIRADALSADFVQGKVEGSATVTLSKSEIDARLSFARLPLESLSQQQDVHGSVRGEARLQGAWSQKLQLIIDSSGDVFKPGFADTVLNGKHAYRVNAQIFDDKVDIKRFDLKGPLVDIQARGFVHTAAATLDLKVAGSVAQLDKVLRLEDERLSISPCTFQTSISGPYAQWLVNARGACPLTTYAHLKLSDTRFVARVEPNRVEVSEFVSRLADGVVDGKLSLSKRKDWSMQGNARISSAQLGKVVGLADETLSGLLDGTALFRGSLSDPQVEAALTARKIQFADADTMSIDSELALVGKGLRLTKFELRSENLDADLLADANARLDLNTRSLDGHINVGKLSLARLPYLSNSVGGFAKGAIVVGGTLDAPQLQGLIALHRVNFADNVAREGQLALCLRDQAWRGDLLIGTQTPDLKPCVPASVTVNDVDVQVQTVFLVPVRHLSLRGHINGIPLRSQFEKVSELRDLDGIGSATFDVKGPLDALLGRASLRVDGLALQQRAIGELQLDARLEGSRVDVRVQALGGQVSGDAIVELEKDNMRLSAKMALLRFAPEQVSASLRDRKIRVLVDGDLLLDYAQQRTGAVHATLNLRKGELHAPQAEAIYIHAPTQLTYQDQQFTLDKTELVSAESHAFVQGSYAPAKVDIQANGEIALALLPLVTSEIIAAQGFADVAFTATGTQSQPRLHGRLVPKAGASVTPRSLGRPIQLVRGSLSFSPEEIRAVDFNARGLGGELWLDGALSLKESEVLAYDVKARADHVQLRLERSRAEVSGDLSLIGAANSPRLQGTIDIVEARFFERYRLRNFIATTTSSSSALSLADRLPRFADTQMDVRLSASDVRARADMGSVVTDLNGSADLHIGGSLRDLSLDGVVDVSDGRVTLLEHRLEVQSAVIDFPQRPDRRIVPRIDLTATSTIEAASSPTGAELPVVLTLTGDSQRMLMDVQADEAGQGLSRVELLTLLATGHTVGTVLGESSGDTAVRLVSREMFSEAERKIEKLLELAAGKSDDRDIDVVLELGTTGWRGGVRWDLSRRLQFEGETIYAFGDSSGQQRFDAADALRQAVRVRWLFADHLPLVDSIAVEASVEDLSTAADVYSDVELNLKLRIFDL